MRAKIFSHIFRYFLVTTNLLSVLLLVASSYSDRVPPEKVLFFSYLGLLFPFICLLNLCFILYWIFLGQWKYLLIGLCAFLVCWKPVKNYFPVHLPSPPVREDVVKLLTYNVMGFTGKDGASYKILRYIADSQADIVCLQEYLAGRSGSALTAREIDEALRMYPYSSVIYLKTFGWGLAVYSKYPITASRKVEYFSENNGSSVHEIAIGGKTLTLINNHLESFKLTSQDKEHYGDFLKATGAESFGHLRNTIQRKLGPAFRIRAGQARVVAEEVRKSTSDYLLVCGDFNDTPVSYTHRTMQGELQDAFAHSGTGLGITYNRNYFWFRIDYILYSPNMEAMNCTVDPLNYSDHYPVWCYLKLN
ncbi:MAG: endonuclease/exonuclease/phosphatase family protein [Tannerellaceae bacterium]|nr:endonuclease/exonuclease/phosphatase family protein [Tannerellaceae bacterium]